jgi:hypothetical protein
MVELDRQSAAAEVTCSGSVAIQHRTFSIIAGLHWISSMIRHVDKHCNKLERRVSWRELESLPSGMEYAALGCAMACLYIKILPR